MLYKRSDMTPFCTAGYRGRQMGRELQEAGVPRTLADLLNALRTLKLGLNALQTLRCDAVLYGRVPQVQTLKT